MAIGYAMAATPVMPPMAGERAMKRRVTTLVAALGAGLLSGCDLAPVYDPPHFILPASYQGR